MNCAVELDLLRTEDYVLIEYHSNITGVSFTITSTKFYATVVTLSINDKIKYLENLNQEFKENNFLE